MKSNQSREIGTNAKGGNPSPLQVVVQGSGSNRGSNASVSMLPESTSTISKKSLMEEIRMAIGDQQRVKSLVAQAESHPLEVWRKALLWASTSGHTGLLSHFLEETPPSLKGLLQHATDSDHFTALHRAVVAGQVEIVNVLLANSPFDNSTTFDILHARTPEGWTALHLAVVTYDEVMVTALMNCYDRITLPRDSLWDFGDNYWMTPLHYAVLGKMQGMVEMLLEWPKFDRFVNAHDQFNRTAAHMGSSHAGAPMETLANSGKVDLNSVDCCKYTPLHWAVTVGATSAVRSVIAQADHRTIRATDEDIDGLSVLQIAVENTKIDEKVGKDIEKLLQTSSEVKDNVERLYRDRQVYVDAANAILVGAALISSVTFGGFLNPPVGDGGETFQTQEGIFWVFNSLSFFFSIGTVMAGAGAVLPTEDVYIGKAVKDIRSALVLTSALLILCVVFVLGAFGASGFASLTAIPKLQRKMIITTAIGAGMCTLILIWFLGKLNKVRPDWRRFSENIANAWLHFRLKKGRRDYNQIKEEIEGAEVKTWEMMHKKHMSNMMDRKHIDLSNLIVELDEASMESARATALYQPAKKSWFHNRMENMLGNRIAPFESLMYDSTEKVLEKRINLFEKVYQNARLGDDDDRQLQQPTGNQSDPVQLVKNYPSLNALILGNVDPKGVHYWIQTFPSWFCRQHCLKKDKETFNRIKDRVFTHKKSSLAEAAKFETGNLAFENWVPNPQAGPQAPLYSTASGGSASLSVKQSYGSGSYT